jgi:predicted HAD superfamily Cof-like phosphohydrolase
MITQEELKKYLHYEPSTGVFTRLFKSGPRGTVGSIVGYKTKKEYLSIKLLGKTYQAHRLAWLYMHGVWPIKSIDHINGVRGDNSISNLREASEAENGANRRLNTNTTSGYKGVTWHAPSKSWQARCAINGQRYDLGRFQNKYDAAKAYVDFAKAKQGAFYKAPASTMLSDIRDFHVKFGLEYTGVPRLLPKDLADFRIKFLNEEYQEYIKAVAENDLEGSLDALVDLVYIALGTAYLQGLPFKAGWDIVQNCNMAKVRAAADGANSKRGSKHDVVKPEGWQGPDYSKILTGA